MRAARIFIWTESQVAMGDIFGREIEQVEELSEIREFTNALKVRREKTRRRGQLAYQLQRDRIKPISGLDPTARSTRSARDD